MKPLRRSRMFWAGLLGCLLIAGLWVNSIYREYSIWINLPGGSDAVFVTQESGAIAFNYRRYPTGGLRSAGLFSTHAAFRTTDRRVFRAVETLWKRPFFIDHTPGVTSLPAFTMSRVVVPYWLLIVAWVAGWLCLLAIWRRRRSRLAATLAVE